MEVQEAQIATKIIQDILAPRVDPKTICCQRLKGYVAVFLDGDRYRTICRLYLNNKRRQYIGIVGKKKVESRSRISDLTDLYSYANEINDSLNFYQHPEYF